MKPHTFVSVALAALLALAASSAMALDASSIKLAVQSVMPSASPLCTNPITVFNTATPVEMDFLANPTLGSGNPPDATYNCVIIKMSDLIKFKPSSTSGSCSAATEYTIDICRADNGGTTRAPDAGGVASVCTGTDTAPVSNTVFLYLSTNATAGTSGDTFLQPDSASSSYGLNLAAPLVINGSARSKFVVNATGKVDGANGPCGLNPPVFGFQKL